MTFEGARKLFAERGPQPGQPLPKLSLLQLDGTAADLAAIQGKRPLVLVTCSLTCNVARRNQAQVAQLQQRLGERAAVVMLYTIEAHPKGDACPYTGTEWVPEQNATDGVLVRQPTTRDERLALARRYAKDFAGGTTVLVDDLGDAAWKALGEAPNLGLLIGVDGAIVLRTGWCDVQAIERALPAK